MNKNDIKYYAAFSFLNVRPLFKARLFEFFDYDIKRAFLANENNLKQVCDYYQMSFPKDFLSKIAKLDPDECFNKAFKDKNVKILTFNDEKYPPLLKQIPDFPLSLYYKGNLDIINYKYPIAIVGSRLASMRAKCALSNIIKNLENSEIVVVSGLASGIDAQAHISAINNNLKTIAVIGSGLDYMYPSQNKKLYKEIEEKSGVIFSEYPLGTRPLAYNFPQRNRIVVGISKGTLVAEARVKSGAMISANLTLDYNRELMCMPGDILNPNTSGIYELIKNGAGIITSHKDLLNQLGWDIITNRQEVFNEYLTDIQKNISDIISIEPKTFDEIAQKANLETSKIMVTLTELELKGLIKQQGNKYYKCTL